MKHRPYAGLALAGLLGMLLAGLGLAAPAQAAACSDGSGVTVVVQYPDGHTRTGCTGSDPDSGLQALTMAGFHYTFVPGQNGAVCTIDGAPTKDCWGSSYWAYFHASPGGKWVYAQTGASYDPKPGSVEGWRFGGGEAPSTAPPGGSTVKPTPKPTPTKAPSAKPSTKPSAKPSTKPSAGPSTAPGGSVAAPTTGTPTAPDASTTPTATPTTSTTATPGATASATDQASPGDDASTASAAGAVSDDTDGSGPADSTGGGLSWVWGLVLLAALGAAGTVVYLRRRQA